MRKNTPEQAEESRRRSNERANAWRRMQKECHICRQCGGQDAYTLGGRTYCAACCEINNERKRKWRADHPGANAEQVKRYRDKNLAAGVCSQCGRPRTDKTRLLCGECQARQHRYKTNARLSNYPRGENGICWQCNKEPKMEGKNLCAKCYEMKVGILRAVIEKRDNSEHIWRKLKC